MRGFFRSEIRELSGHPRMTQKCDFLVTSRVNDFYKDSTYTYWANFCFAAKIASNCGFIDFFTFKIFEILLKIELTEIRP